MTQGGGAAAKAILTPWRLGRGYGEGSVSFRRRGCLDFFFSLPCFLKERRKTHGSAHTPGGEAGPGAGAAPGFGSGAGGSRWLRIPEFPPQLRRPGNVRPVSGAGAGPGGGGRKEHPSSSHSPRPVASLRQGLKPFPTVLLGDACGEGYGRRRHRKVKHHSLGCGEESGLQATDLEKGKAYPSPSFLSCEISIEEDSLPPTSLPLLPRSLLVIRQAFG